MSKCFGWYTFARSEHEWSAFFATGGHPLESVGSAHQYRGDLSEVALPEILYTIDRFQVPGMIEACRGDVSKQIYIREGSVVHATSTDRNDSLGCFLERHGLLSKEVFAETMAERERSNKRYGNLLVERRILSPAQVYAAVRKQTEAIVWSLFEWLDGSVTFKIGSFGDVDSVRIQLPMRQVIVKGIKRAPNAKALVARLGRKETVFERCDRVEDLIETALDAQEVELLDLVDGKRTLYEICTHGPLGVAENGKLLYAFQVLQLVRRLEVALPSGAPPTESSGAIRIRWKAGERPT